MAVTSEVTVGRGRVGTSASILARILVAALGPGHLTVGASITMCTDASVVVDAIDAGTAVHARRRRTVFVVDLTVGPGEPSTTVAGVGVDIVMAGCPVLARIGGTFVHVNFTFVAAKAVDA